MKNKYYKFILSLLISLMINASEEKKDHMMTVRFFGHFKTPLISWTSHWAKIKAIGSFSDSINPEDGKAGILYNLEIIKVFRQENASIYAYPDCSATSMKEIRAATLWDYRAFELRLFDSCDRFKKSTVLPEESLGESCQTLHINCTSILPVVNVVIATNRLSRSAQWRQLKKKA